MGIFQPPILWESLHLSPIAFEIGPLVIRWYSLAYILGILGGWMLLGRMLERPGAPMTRRNLDDLITWCTLGVIGGGRLAYVIFYDPAKYIADPSAIFRLWEGGMSFHGGLIGTTLAMILFARSRKIKVFSMIDTIAAGVPVGLGLVRVANFINGELWGRITDVPWGMIFPTGGPFVRHPSQLYEAALEGIVLFATLALLIFYGRKLKSPRFIGGAFITGYGLSRIFVEFFREPDAQLGYLYGGWLTMGMILSVPMVLVGLWALLTARNPEVSTGR